MPTTQCSPLVAPLVLSSYLHQLPSQTNCLPDLLRLVEPQPVPVLTEGGGVEGHLPGQSDLAVALVQVDVRFVQEEGEDAGVKSVSDDHSGAAEHRYGPTKHRHVVELSSLVDDFMVELRSCWILHSGVKIFAGVPPVNQIKTELSAERILVQNVPDLDLVSAFRVL